MPIPPLTERLLTLCPPLSALPDALRKDGLTRHSQTLCMPEGQLLFDEGAPCRDFPMLLSGEMRVAHGTPNGRSPERRRVGPGELRTLVATAPPPG